MPLSVNLLGGGQVQISAALDDALGRDLRCAIADRLEVHPQSLQILTSAGVLKDEDPVPTDGEVTVVIGKLPWLDDGSERIVDDDGGECHVGGDEKKGDGKFNALCDVAFDCGNEYFEVDIMQGDGAWVGVTTKAGFKAGYKIRALLYGGPGNLSDGNGLLRSQFGDKVKAGDCIGVTLDLTDPMLFGVAFWHNEKCLGEAYAVPRPEPGCACYPVVCGQQVGDRFRIGLNREVRARPAAEPAHPAEGNWRLQKLFLGPELGQVDVDQILGGVGRAVGPGDGVTLFVKREAEAGKFHLKLQVCNGFQVKVQATPSEEGRAPFPFEELVLSNIMGTMMMAPPELMELENRLGEHMPNIVKWLAQGSSPDDAAATLMLQGSIIEMGFVRGKPGDDQGPITDVKLPWE